MGNSAWNSPVVNQDSNQPLISQIRMCFRRVNQRSGSASNFFLNFDDSGESSRGSIANSLLYSSISAGGCSMKNAQGRSTSGIARAWSSGSSSMKLIGSRSSVLRDVFERIFKGGWSEDVVAVDT